MFTGIIEEQGQIQSIAHQKNLSVLKVRVKKLVRGTKKGDSIAMNGVCLTVTNIQKNILSFDVMQETLDKTNLGELKPNALVNLEGAMKLGDRLHGHIVTGHVDCVGEIWERIARKNYVEFKIKFNPLIRPYIVPKGSICIDGVSLTVGAVQRHHFSIYLIPFTLKITTLGLKKAKDKVNIEADILAKYILQK
jgi:riboflavin synthase